MPGTNNSINRTTTSNNAYINVFTLGTGNPNGVVAGTATDEFFDTAASILYICTTTGTTSTAVWTAIGANSALSWVNVTGATQAIAPNTGYIANNASGITTFTLPSTIAVTQRFSIRGGLSTSWALTCTGSTVRFGNVSPTTSITSTNASDQLDGICYVANTTFDVSCPSGNLTWV
jgi:hypothetical protein